MITQETEPLIPKRHNSERTFPRSTIVFAMLPDRIEMFDQPTIIRNAMTNRLKMCFV